MRPIPGVSQHARLRMIERHGIEPRRGEWIDVVTAILEGRALLMGRNMQTSRERFRVVLGGHEVELWWCPISSQIVTVMPAGAEVHRIGIKKSGNAFRARAYERERRRPRIDPEDMA